MNPVITIVDLDPSETYNRKNWEKWVEKERYAPPRKRPKIRAPRLPIELRFADPHDSNHEEYMRRKENDVNPHPMFTSEWFKHDRGFVHNQFGKELVQGATFAQQVVLPSLLQGGTNFPMRYHKYFNMQALDVLQSNKIKAHMKPFFSDLVRWETHKTGAPIAERLVHPLNWAVPEVAGHGNTSTPSYEIYAKYREYLPTRGVLEKREAIVPVGATFLTNHAAVRGRFLFQRNHQTDPEWLPHEIRNEGHSRNILSETNWRRFAAEQGFPTKEEYQSAGIDHPNVIVEWDPLTELGAYPYGVGAVNEQYIDNFRVHWGFHNKADWLVATAGQRQRLQELRKKYPGNTFRIRYQVIDPARDASADAPAWTRHQEEAPWSETGYKTVWRKS
jgi:hypothetical protein